MKSPFTTRLAAAAALAACTSWAGAGIVSLSVDPASPFSVGSSVTFTVHDSRPLDMFDAGAGLAAADFSFVYDPAVLGFVALAYPGWITAASTTFALDNGLLPPVGEVLVTIAGTDANELPPAPDELFEVSFVVRQGSAGSVTVAPYPGDPAGVPSYAFAPASLQFAVNAVPLPSTLALAALGLLLAGTAARRAQPGRG